MPVELRNLGENRSILARSILARSMRFEGTGLCARQGAQVIGVSSLWFVIVFQVFAIAPRLRAEQDTSKIVLPGTAYLFVGVSGFIPFKESYRINYSTKVAGLPIELNGGLSFPINGTVLVPFTVRYIRRTVTLVPDLTLSMIDIEPGVRVYLEKYEERELRFYAGASAILARATIHATYDVSAAGAVTGQASASKDYINYGVGIDLGLAYPLTETSAIDGGVHLGILLGSPVAHGGLGNIGGVSIGATYRIGF